VLLNQQNTMSLSNPNPSSAIVVLGGSNDETGKLSQMSLDRCDQAVITHKAHPLHPILTTGGWGDHFNQSSESQGEWMKRELIRRGISESLFLPVALSAYTEEDATSAKRTLSPESLSRIFLITSEFHMDRASHYFRDVFQDVEIMPCPAKSNLTPDELAQRVAHEQKRIKEILRSSGKQKNRGQ
jgi:uncharacterized SAM-binding protein YcdF (DUF218 family)